MAQRSQRAGGSRMTELSAAAQDEHDWFDSAPTPAQYVSDVNNADDIFDSLSEDKAKILELQGLFNSQPKSFFLSELISRVSSDDLKLEELRDIVFEEIRGLGDYPYPRKAGLKRRVCRRNGDSVSFKLASDIYSLVSVIDGGSFEEMRELLNMPRQSRSDIDSSQNNAAGIDVLSSTVAKLQADMLKMKQEKDRLGLFIEEEIKALKSSIKRLELDSIKDIRDKIAVNAQSIDRILDDKSSGVARLKIDVKLLRDEMRSTTEECDRCIKQIRLDVESCSKTVEKRLNKVELKLKDRAAPSPEKLDLEEVQHTRAANPAKDTDVVYMGTDGGNQRSDRRQRTKRSTDRETVAPVNTGAKASSTYVDNSKSDPPASGAPVGAVGSSAPPCSSLSRSGITSESDDVIIARPLGTGSGSGDSQLYRLISDSGSRFVRGADNVRQHVSYKSVLVGEKSGHGNQGSSPRPVTGAAVWGADTGSGVSASEKETNGGEFDDFIKHVRKRTKRFYLGRFKRGITEDCIKHYIEGNQGPKVDRIDILTPRSGFDLYLRVSVEIENSDRLLDADFWPGNLVCHPWVSRESQQRSGRPETSDRQYGRYRQRTNR